MDGGGGGYGCAEVEKRGDTDAVGFLYDGVEIQYTKGESGR